MESPFSVMFLRPQPAAPPAELPRMGRYMGAVNPLAHLHDANSRGQYYRESGITRQAQATKTRLAQVKPQLKALSQVSSKPSSLTLYRRFADTVLATYDAIWAEVSKPRWANAEFRLHCGKPRVVARFCSKLIKQAKQRWPDCILALAYGAAGFNGSGTIGCRGVPVSQMLKEALRHFPAGFYDRDVAAVLSIRRCGVGPSPRPPELCYWNGSPAMPKFYDRDVAAVLSIRRCAVGPSPRPPELCYWNGSPAMPNGGASCSGRQLWQDFPNINNILDPHKGDVCGLELLGDL
ncbi:hypothetical protein QJQ45_025398 [Haematococcus lacustris]|nr:hypothetical protein QJQ45_025398 [Haematococcus lacustris]